MFRTIAVFILLLGLATATPVVCLCVPSVAVAGGAAGLLSPAMDAGAGGSARLNTAESASARRTANAPSLVATSAAAVVATLVATAGGLPSALPWQPPRPVVARGLLPITRMLAAGPSWSPVPPPPR